MSRLAAALGAVAVLAVPGTAAAVPIVVTSESGTPQTVAVVDSAAPATFTYGPTAITGLGATERVVGIDYRPNTGELITLTVDGADAGRLYDLEPLSGVLTRTKLAPLNLTGTHFGFDFDPMSGFLAINSDAELDMRVNMELFGLTGSPLAYASGDANAGANPNVVAAAFSNNVPGGAGSTTLYGIDSVADVLVTRTNQGQLSTVGPVAGDIEPPAGFDISQSGIGYAALTAPAFLGYSFLASMNLTTGAQTVIDNIGTALTNTPGRYSGLAVAPPSYYVIADTGVSENAGTASVTVTRRSPFGAGSVFFNTAPGSADAPGDYTAVVGTLTFADGERTKVVTVPIVDDAEDEAAAAESFAVRLLSPTAGGRVVDGEAAVSIVDDDPVPAVPSPSPSPSPSLSPSATPGLTPAPPVVGPVARVTPTLRIKVTPKRDTSNPRVFTTTGTVGVPAGTNPAAACATGRVIVTFKAGTSTISSRAATLTATCTFRSKVSFKVPRRLLKRRTLTVRAAFQGTPALTARTAATTIRVR